MCGIAGFVDYDLQYDDLVRMTNSIEKRGPDGAGYFFEKNVGLGHRRLSIIELSHLGNQPYIYEQYVLVFNGEIYNYVEIRNELIQLGYSFQSNSDTEVLIKAFHQWEEACVSKFIGMFAFCIYNKKTEETFLFRDRVGVKPLYYSVQRGLLFGSELKVFKTLGIKFELNEWAVWEYFKLGYITNENSIFKDVFKLLPGCYLRYYKHQFSIHQYWKPFIKNKEFESELDVKKELHELLVSSFKFRMRSDVPVGVFLSGGIDSSLVSAILNQNDSQINTFTIGFNNHKYNEAPYAKEIAHHIGSSHQEFVMTERHAKDLLYNFYDIYDEPFSDSSGIPTAFISQLAKENNIKVVLSADGGDELFCGYSHYNRIEKSYLNWNAKNKQLLAFQNLISKSILNSGVLDHIYKANIKHKVSAFETLNSSFDFNEYYQNSISNQGNFELNEMLTFNKDFKSHRFAYLNQKSIVENMAYWDMLHYLPDDILVKVDRATMHVGIEGREPFLDHRLVEFALNLPIQYKLNKGKNKYILRQILSDYVPEKLFERPKKGFSIPLFQWLSGELGELFEIYITREKLNAVNIFDVEEVMEEYNKFKYYKLIGKEYNIEKMWRILSFMMWWEKWGVEMS
jgi:asparagine synthase (glutamine-hydrolysing)